jgi:hypothetical protein
MTKIVGEIRETGVDADAQPSALMLAAHSTHSGTTAGSGNVEVGGWLLPAHMLFLP